MTKRFTTLVVVIFLAGTVQVWAAGLISKAQAEKDALNAVGGGTVIQAILETELRRKIWSVDVVGATHEYEVWVDAHTNAILKVITQHLAPAGILIPKSQAEQDALNSSGGGTVVQARLDKTSQGERIWLVDIVSETNQYEVSADAYTGALVKLVNQPLAAAACKFISKAAAEKKALAVVGGGKVVQALLEKNDTPPVWSVDVLATKGGEYEVKVNACNGSIVAIIPGG